MPFVQVEIHVLRFTVTFVKREYVNTRLLRPAPSVIHAQMIKSGRRAV